jgi:hypothetical protein
VPITSIFSSIANGTFVIVIGHLYALIGKANDVTLVFGES